MLYSIDLKKGNLEEFKTKGFDFLKNIITQEKEEIFIIKENHCLKIEKNLNKKDILSKLKDTLNNVYKQVKSENVEEGRELLDIDIEINKTTYNNEKFKEIKIDIKKSQYGRGTAIIIKSISLYCLNGLEKFNNFKAELLKSELSNNSKEYVLETFLESSSIYTNLNSIIKDEFDCIVDDIKTAINKGYLNGDNLSNNTIKDYLIDIKNNYLLDNLKIICTKVNEYDSDISLKLLNNNQILKVKVDEFKFVV